MPHSNSGSFRQQVGLLRRLFLQGGDLPFTDVLTEQVLAQARATLHGWLDRIFSPLVPLWGLRGQLLNADHSGRAAVARLIAPRLTRGQRPCSADTDAYGQARRRLPETFFADGTCSVARALDDRAQRRWLGKGRRVYRFDSTTVTMPDTPRTRRPTRRSTTTSPGSACPSRVSGR